MKSMAKPRPGPRTLGPVLLRFLILGLNCLPFLAGALRAAGVTPNARIEEANRFFADGIIPHIHIDVAKTNLNRLRNNPRAYVRATVREADRVYEEVGIHLKGAAGSFQAVDDAKPALTLNFDKFV